MLSSSVVERAASPFDERAVLGPAGEGLDPEGAAAGVEIGDPGVDDHVEARQGVEDGLADLVRCRPGHSVGRCRQLPPPELSRDARARMRGYGGRAVDQEVDRCHGHSPC